MIKVLSWPEHVFFFPQLQNSYSTPTSVFKPAACDTVVLGNVIRHGPHLFIFLITIYDKFSYLRWNTECLVVISHSVFSSVFAVSQLWLVTDGRQEQVHYSLHQHVNFLWVENTISPESWMHKPNNILECEILSLYPTAQLPLRV